MGRCATLRYTGSRHTESGVENSRSRRSSHERTHHLHQQREQPPASLIVGKVYRTLPDAEASVHDLLRVIDEDTSEPDGYLYPASMFSLIEDYGTIQPNLANSTSIYATEPLTRWLISSAKERTTLTYGEAKRRLEAGYGFNTIFSTTMGYVAGTAMI